MIVKEVPESHFQQNVLQHEVLMTRDLVKPATLYCAVLLLLCTVPSHLISQTLTLQRPGPREFVIDRANMLDAGDKAFIQETCDELLFDHTVPLIVVTIESMGRYSSTSMAIEEFAGVLYNQWGIGYPKKDGKPWNKGILLLVSRDDRKARIILGAGYGHEQDVECNGIMQKKIIRHFIISDFSAGIRLGVKALDTMARETEGEVSAASMIIDWALLFIPIALTIFSAFSFVRTGRRGLAWLMWGTLFSFPASLLSGVWSSNINSGGLTDTSLGGGWGGSDSFSGGSFGGGFSGGGGATGSW